MTAYKTLESHFKRINAIDGANAILGWDNATMMPAGGAAARAEQCATLSSLAHTIITSPEIGGLIQEAEENALTLSPWQQANLTEMKRLWVHNTAIDSDLVEAFSKAGTECETIWRNARENNDFQTLKPYLENVLNLTKHVATAKAEKFNCSPYEALIDQYDPGTTINEIDTVFKELKSFLPDLIDQATTTSNARPYIPLEGTVPINKQKELGKLCMGAIGFDFSQGRIDTSHHPFCGGIPGDIRITTRYDKNDFTSALMGVNHETGHAMYENSLPKEWLAQPVGKARGMAIHESQSLLIEMQVCRSKEFLSFLQPHIKNILQVNGPAWEIDNLYTHWTKVAGSLIRVDADEVTYPAHVMLRYDLEKALLSGDLTVSDLPTAWNDKMLEYLGITPDSDANGCMQDIHWMDGSLGYFPSYTLGAIIAAQLFTQAKQSIPTTLGELEKGNFKPLMAWLKENIHSKASSLSTKELLTAATGKPIDVSSYKKHLEQRYLES